MQTLTFTSIAKAVSHVTRELATITTIACKCDACQATRRATVQGDYGHATPKLYSTRTGL